MQEVTRDGANYDVAIIGGGMAGMTLALQLKNADDQISIIILERRTGKAPVACHKVGESMSELGSYYLRETLGLRDYLVKHHLPKFGFRFFFSAHRSDDITRRVEIGSRIDNPFPSHQIDRGLFENDLEEMLTAKGVQFRLGTTVTDVKFSNQSHIVTYGNGETTNTVTCKWVVDASGRSSFLKRKLALNKPTDHHVNAVWFRVESDLDIDDWSQDQFWHSHLDPGRRRLATNHLVGQGYWVWIIPLVSGHTSIGIVADPRYHQFESINTFQKALSWLATHEPQAANVIGELRIADFKIMKDFSYDSSQYFSEQGWGLIGESGVFLDPLYSPGTDFIALENTWLCDLIIRSLRGENISMRSKIFELTQRELIRGWSELYRDMYGLMDKTQIMLMKIVWDWATYWSIPNVMFSSGGYTDIDVLKKYSSSSANLGRRFATLNSSMQKLFRDWSKYETQVLEDQYRNVFDLRFLYKLQDELNHVSTRDDVISRVRSNLELLEQIAADIFRRISHRVKGTPDDMPVNPFSMSLEDDLDALMEKCRQAGVIQIDPSVRDDISMMWLEPVMTKSAP